MLVHLDHHSDPLRHRAIAVDVKSFQLSDTLELAGDFLCYDMWHPIFFEHCLTMSYSRGDSGVIVEGNDQFLELGHTGKNLCKLCNLELHFGVNITRLCVEQVRTLFH